jgi:hypothetical protein
MKKFSRSIVRTALFVIGLMTAVEGAQANTFSTQWVVTGAQTSFSDESPPELPVSVGDIIDVRAIMSKADPSFGEPGGGVYNPPRVDFEIRLGKKREALRTYGPSIPESVVRLNNGPAGDSVYMTTRHTMFDWRGVTYAPGPGRPDVVLSIRDSSGMMLDSERYAVLFTDLDFSGVDSSLLAITLNFAEPMQPERSWMITADSSLGGGLVTPEPASGLLMMLGLGLLARTRLPASA